METQKIPQATLLLRKLALLWEGEVHNWAQILCRGPDGHPYVIEERELQWANPSLQFPIPEVLTQALKYLRVVIFSRDSANWLSLCQQLILPHGLDYPIAPRWRTMLDPD